MKLMRGILNQSGEEMSENSKILPKSGKLKSLNPLLGAPDVKKTGQSGNTR
ncbi:hypothetical protein [Desulfovibrio sp. TomC]|uniref:hypothetical protein n=1 Tax=Desulfovibrio sp. TomC TaxID=1562888 RepID=UPI0012E316D3|nr:hypothetical protein [Desulfovibrio sp. TomC]